MFFWQETVSSCASLAQVWEIENALLFCWPVVRRRPLAPGCSGISIGSVALLEDDEAVVGAVGRKIKTKSQI